MIHYDSKNILDVVFRWEGSIISIDSRLWVSLILTWLISLGVTYFFDASIFKHSGSSYLEILGKVLVFLMVFRSKLTYDRFWKGRIAMQDLRAACVQTISDASVVFETNDAAAVTARQELYRLTLMTFVAMQIHMRKEYDDLRKIYKDKGQESNDKWLPEVDRRRLDMAKAAGLITETELKTLLESGLNYVPVCSTWFGRSVARAFQNKMMHRNLMLDIDASMRKMIASWYACEKISYNPFPFPYVQALSIFLLLFIYTMPLALVTSMGPWTPVATPLIVLGFCGLDAVGAELEDPFGEDKNDFPMPEWAQETADAAWAVASARDKDMPRYIIGPIFKPMM